MRGKRACEGARPGIDNDWGTPGIARRRTAHRLPHSRRLDPVLPAGGELCLGNAHSRGIPTPLVINLKAAQTLGVTIPKSVMDQATDVIQ
jgi:hypothetical protein